jgi:hypothetical protein
MADFDVADEKDVITYWQGILGTPSNSNPSTDPDGSKHNVETNPVYLASTARGKSNRKLKAISSDKSIFIPVNPVVISEPEVPNHSVQECNKYAKEDEDTASVANLTIDGAKYTLKDLQHCRVHTQAFDVNIPPNGVQNLPHGKCKAVADGYYVIIKPLPVGSHTIRFEGKVENPAIESEREPHWDQDITYDFEVK